MMTCLQVANPCYAFYPRGSETLIVWFGGINEPYISENLALETNVDVLAVRDVKFSWYMNGILDEQESVEAGMEWLSSVISPYRHVAFCGQSSGGYGAMLYGALCKADLCIAFSPQTRNMADGQNHIVPRQKLVDLRTVYEHDAPKPRLILNLARSEKDHEDSFFWDDWRQVEYFRNLSFCTLLVHPFDNHSVSVCLRNEGRLYRLISGLLWAYLPGCAKLR